MQRVFFTKLTVHLHLHARLQLFLIFLTVVCNAFAIGFGTLKLNSIIL